MRGSAYWELRSKAVTLMRLAIAAVMRHSVCTQFNAGSRDVRSCESSEPRSYGNPCLRFAILAEIRDAYESPMSGQSALPRRRAYQRGTWPGNLLRRFSAANIARGEAGGGTKDRCGELLVRCPRQSPVTGGTLCLRVGSAPEIREHASSVCLER